MTMDTGNLNPAPGTRPAASLRPAPAGRPGAGASGNDDGLQVVRAKHPWQWVSAVVVLVLAALALRSVLTNPNFGWDVVAAYIRDFSIVQGMAITLQLTVISMAIGIVLGVLLAVMRLSSNVVVKSAASAFVYLDRKSVV